MIQNLCGHSRSDMTLDIYTTVTKELKQAEFDDFQKKLKEKKQEWKNRQERMRDSLLALSKKSYCISSGSKIIINVKGNKR